MNNIIAKRIEALRESRGLIQSELADLAHIEPSYVSKLEAGKAPNVSGIIIARIARALDTTTDFLLAVSDISSPPPNPSTLAAIERAMLDPKLRKLIEVLVALWPRLDDAAQEAIRDVVVALAEIVHNRRNGP